MHSLSLVATCGDGCAKPLGGQMDDIDGLWRVVRYNDGEERRGRSLDSMAQHAFLPTETDNWCGAAKSGIPAGSP